MAAECYCCKEPSLGSVNGQFACLLCLSTFCQPETSEAHSCPRCLQRQNQASICVCGYAGPLQPCCPVCLYSKVEDFVAAAEEDWWTCEKCGLVGLRTQFCIRCAQERPVIEEVPKPEESQCSADIPVVSEAAANVQAIDMWKCTHCNFEQNTELNCQVCGSHVLSPVVNLVNELLSPPASQPTWNCPECNSANSEDFVDCPNCECPKDATGPPCANCACLNRAGIQKCRRCGVPIFLPLPPIPVCPQCGGSLPGNGQTCPCLDQLRASKRSNWVNFRTSVEAEGKKLIKRLFH